jgi:hypothetical protein
MSKPKTRWIVIFAILTVLQLLVLFKAGDPISDQADQSINRIPHG